MKEISFYLTKYNNIGRDQRLIKKSLIDSIKEVCGIVVDKNNVKINKKTINLDIQGPKKSEIFIKNNKVQKKFNEKMEDNGIKIDTKKIF